ncbi:MAG: GDSL-type esterase/lipase family protein [Verrucomicrobiota bacterium]
MHQPPRRRAIACLVLSPAGFLQSRSGAEEPGPERWAEDIAEFGEKDRESPSPPGSILFVGSSSIRRWDLETSWKDRETINRGFGGSTIADAIHYFDPLFSPHRPRAIILYTGENDINRGSSPATVEDRFRTLTDRIQAQFPAIPVVFLSIKPSRKRWELWSEMAEANRRIKAICETKPALFFADTATPMLESVGPDGPSMDWFVEDELHLSDWGYQCWTAIVETYLESIAK